MRRQDDAVVTVFITYSMSNSSISKELSPLEGTGSVAHFISQNPISSKPGKGGVQAQKWHKIDKVRPNFTFQDPHGPYRPHLGQF